MRCFVAVAVAVMLALPAAAGAATGNIFTAAGTGTAGFGGDDGPAAQAQLAAPVWAARTADGGYLVADQGNVRVRRVSPGGTITTVAGNGTTGSGGDDGPATSAEFNTINGVAEMPDGGFLIADAGNNRIRRVSPGGTITTVAGTGVGTYGGDDGPATSAQLKFPSAIAVRSDGSFLIADNDNNRVRQVSVDGTITTVAGTGTPGGDGDGGLATAAQLSKPSDVALLPDGGFLITEQTGNRVRRVARDGTITRVAGTGTAGSTGDGGPADAATLDRPSALAVMPDGGFLVSELNGNRVRRVHADATIGPFAGTGTSGFGGDGGDPTAAQLATPIGLTLTASEGDVLIADTANHRVRVVDIGDPPPPPPPGATPPPPATAPSGPTVTGIALHTPLISGRPALIAAQVEGQVSELDWDINGDRITDVVCAGDQPLLSYRAPALPGTRLLLDPSIGVTAVSALGLQSPKYVVNAPVAAAPIGPSPGLAAASLTTIKRLVDGVGAARCISGDAPAATALSPAKCLTSTVVTNGIRISGCLKPVYSVGAIPEAERGILRELAERIGASATATAMSSALAATSAYVADGDVTMNGVRIDPGPGAVVVVHQELQAIASSNAQLSTAGILLDNTRRFELFTSGSGDLDLGLFRRAGGAQAVTGLPLVSDVAVRLVRSSGLDAHALVGTDLKLPEPFDGLIDRSRVDMHLGANGRLVLDGLRLGPIDAAIGPVGITGLQLTYAGGAWDGGGKVCLPLGCLQGHVVFRDGTLELLDMHLVFTPGLTIFPGVQLNHIDGGFSRDPLRITAGAGINAAALYDIDGQLVLGFPRAGLPFNLTEADAPFVPATLRRAYDTFTLALSGKGSLHIPAIDARVGLGGGYALYNYPAYVAFGGGIDYSFFGLVSMRGLVGGEVNFQTGRFNLGGSVEGCILDLLCRGFTGVVSSRAAGGCAHLDFAITDIDIGGGVIYSPFEVVLSPWGCKWSEFKEPHVFRQQTQGTGPFTLTFKDGDASRAMRLDGADAAPRVHVSGPGGVALDSPDGAGVTTGGGVAVMRSEQLKMTLVTVLDPKPGSYGVTLLPGSAPVAKRTDATEPPKAAVRATLSARGARRVLRYDITPRPDQQVTFVEAGTQGSRVLGAAKGTRGTLAFTPAPGSGVSRIEARFELAGLPAETITVARFRPPPARLARPGGLRARHAGDRLHVRWAAVPGAARYEVTAALASGGQRIVRTARTSATITRANRRSAGRVSVRAVAAGRVGAARSVAFRATAARAPTRLRPLPRAPRGLRG